MNVLALLRLKALIVLAPLLFSPVSIPAQGTVFPHNVVLSPAFGAMPPGTYLTQIQYPGNAGLFAVSVSTIGNGQSRFQAYGIAELYSLHAASLELGVYPDVCERRHSIVEQPRQSTIHNIAIRRREQAVRILG